MFNPRESFKNLADHPDLQKLLDSARSKVAATQPAAAPTALPDPATTDKTASSAQRLASDLANTFQETANDGLTSRTQKVAMVRHLIETGARVLA